MADYTPKFLPGQNVTYSAGAAITGGQVVYLSAAGTCLLTAAAHANVLGVATRDVASGELLAVSRGGVQRCTSGAAIAVGDPLKSAATGRVVPFVVGTDAETLRIGFALTAVGAAAASVDVQWKA
jgi:predicted RecA/RadA family phage recombinase